MTRVAAILYGQKSVKAFFVVMLFADTVVLAIVWFTPLPILSAMGGIRLSESEQVLQSVGFLVRLLSTITWPIWLVGTAFISASISSRDVDYRGASSQPVASGTRALAIFAILVWAAILPSTQIEQRNRRTVEWYLRAGYVSEAIQYMSQRERGDFPPHWDPPPRLGFADHKPLLVDVLLRLNRTDVPTWVRELFCDKLAVQSRADPYDFYRHAILLNDMTDEQLAGYARLLTSIPVGPAMARYHETEIEAQFDQAIDSEKGPLTDRQWKSLAELIDLLPEKNERLKEMLKLRIANDQAEPSRTGS